MMIDQVLETLSEIFLKIVNMSISAGWIVLAVILLRLIFKKAPKWLNCVLWGIVALRLLMPFSLESVFSLIPSAQTISPEIMLNKTPEINTGVDSLNSILNPIITNSFAPEPFTSINPLQALIPIWSVIWVLGIVALLIYTLITYLRLSRKVRTAVLLKDNVYQSENVVSPFLLGLIKPKIYLPFNMDEETINHVISHETAHIKRLDYLIKPLGFLLLSVYWFNPLVWLGYILLCRDIELACDERVVKEFSSEEKAEYSQALLSCSINRRTIAACPLAFGEVGVKGRVKSVLNYKKPTFWVLIVSIALSIVAAVCFLTNPVSIKGELAVFLDMRISEHNYSETHTDNNFVAISIETLGTKKKGNEITVYAWVLYQEYNLVNGKIKEMSGSHIPTVITAKKTGSHGHYELVEYWEPRDGTYYPEDIKQKFPWYLRLKALDSQRYIKKQKAFCQNSAEEYFKDISYIGGTYGIDIQTATTLSFVNYVESNEFYAGALNSSKFIESKIRHLPIYKFDTLKELNDFKERFKTTFPFDFTYNEVPSFNSATAKYDDEFFNENSLLLIYVEASNATHRFGVSSVGYDDTHFYVNVMETTGAECVDCMMAGWFITLAVSDELIKNCTEFDADFQNVIELLYEETPHEEHSAKLENGEYFITKTHYKSNDVWMCNNYAYKYRLEVSGRMSNAAKSTTYIVLSNTEDLTFKQVAMASGLSSNSNDYFTPDFAVIVGYKMY